MRIYSVFWHLALSALSSAALRTGGSHAEDGTKIALSPLLWVMEKACSYLNICEDLQQQIPIAKANQPSPPPGHSTEGRTDSTKARSSNSDPASTIPAYVLNYAPLVYLHSGEKFWPCDMAEHLEHVTPYLNYTPMAASSAGLNLTNLDKLNHYTNGRFVFLTSDDNVEERPDWLEGEKNIPDYPEEPYQKLPAGDHDPQNPLGANKESEILGGRSEAPAVLVLVDKGQGIIDAFWFFFYSYNLGNLVFNIRFGNHIGDWEHCLVRFIDGKPEYVFVSEHFFGQAYTYDAVEKIGKRVRMNPSQFICRN